MIKGLNDSTPDTTDKIVVVLVVVVLVARIGRVPVLVPRVRGACSCTHTTRSRILHYATGWVAFSLPQG